MGFNCPSHKNKHNFSDLLQNFYNDELSLFDSYSNRHHHPNISLSEDEQKVYVDAALPGLKKEEIEITLEKGILWIQGQKHETEDHKKYHYKAKSSYSYQISLPDSVNEHQTPDAKYENGVLHIEFNKSRGQESKKIRIA